MGPVETGAGESAFQAEDVAWAPFRRQEGGDVGSGQCLEGQVHEDA